MVHPIGYKQCAVVLALLEPGIGEPNGSNPMDFQRKSLSYRKRAHHKKNERKRSFFDGTPDRIRTYDTWFRRPVL